MKDIDKTGWIGFVQGRGLLAWLIKFFGKTTISHVVLGYKDDFVLEATNPVVKFSRISRHYKSDRIEWYRPSGVPLATANAVIEELMEKYYDVGYGFLQLVGYAWCVIYRSIFGRVIKNPFENGSDKIVCAELGLFYLQDKRIFSILSEIDREILEKIHAHDPYFMTHIYNLVKGSSSFTIKNME